MMDFDMGKYGLFVWGSYGLSAVALMALACLSLMAHKRLQKTLAALNAHKDHGDAQ
jgi:heme exporter protein D